MAMRLQFGLASHGATGPLLRVASLGARPAFSLVVVLTLALAIGANAAIFSALQAVLFNSHPRA